MFKRVGPAETDDANKAVVAVGIILYVALFSDFRRDFLSKYPGGVSDGKGG